MSTVAQDSQEVSLSIGGFGDFTFNYISDEEKKSYRLWGAFKADRRISITIIEVVMETMFGNFEFVRGCYVFYTDPGCLNSKDLFRRARTLAFKAKNLYWLQKNEHKDARLRGKQNKIHPAY